MFSHHIGGTVNMDIISIKVYRPHRLTVGQIGMLTRDTGILFAFLVVTVAVMVSDIKFFDRSIDKLVCHLQNLSLLFIGQLPRHQLKTKQGFPVLFRRAYLDIPEFILAFHTGDLLP